MPDLYGRRARVGEAGLARRGALAQSLPILSLSVFPPGSDAGISSDLPLPTEATLHHLGGGAGAEWDTENAGVPWLPHSDVNINKRSTHPLCDGQPMPRVRPSLSNGNMHTTRGLVITLSPQIPDVKSPTQPQNPRRAGPALPEGFPMC